MSSLVAFFSNLDRSKVNLLVAAACGWFFSTGWWCMIDVVSTYGDVVAENKVYCLPGVFATISMFLVNIVPTAVIKESYYYGNGRNCAPSVALLSLFVGLMVAFGSMIGATYILINDFLLRPKEQQWPGAGIFLQNLFIFFANMLFKFGILVENF